MEFIFARYSTRGPDAERTAPREPRPERTAMSRQLTFSAAVSTLVLALFALTTGHQAAPGGIDAAGGLPFAASAAIN